ncbi:MAG: glutaminyl-peptide cyclotransferase [Acidimicrobiales bacterium]|nr:glutaminyl-peptide cyclotransferase [Acidimicrobiales bacterium]MDP6697563.1 glutaminyl-peptide cyclotransferase [Acidimicrobiales bacterium]
MSRPRLHRRRSVNPGTASLHAAVFACGLTLATSCGVGDGGTPVSLSGPAAPEPGSTTGEMRVEVVAEHPHDPTAFTQGLELVDGRLFESTGRYGTSTIREVDLATGGILASTGLDDTVFGEGITAIGGGRLLQLTWKAGIATVWDLDHLERVDTWSYEGEGWGVCLLDPETLVVSDGSATLTFRSAADFHALGSVVVAREELPQELLNELECVNGTVWANVWKADTILGIDPTTGIVFAAVDASSLPVERASLAPGSVLNGIAHDPSTGRFLLTGKYWPSLFEVEFRAG